MLPIAAAVVLLGILGGAETLNFDRLSSGAMPPSWSAPAITNGKPPHWAVAPDPSAPSRHNVFAQLSSDSGRSREPLAIFDKVVCADGDLSAKFKIVKGRENASAGVVWRYQDPRNYYYLQFSANRKRITLYRMQNGNLTALPIHESAQTVSEISRDLKPDQWYVVRVVYKGGHFKVWFCNRKLFEADDNALTAAGKTGVCTRGDTVAYFDDFRIDKKS